MAKSLKLSRNELQKRLQIHGLNVLSDALSLIETELINGYPPYQSIDDFISLLTKILVINCKTEDFIIDANTSQTAIDLLKESRICRTADNELVVKNVESDHYNQHNNYRNHFNQLLKALKKHDLFVGNKFKITPIDDLITSDQQSIDCIVYGFIFKDNSKISQYMVEDSSGKVPIAFTDESQWRDDVIVENCFVLIEGTYSSSKDYLYVNAIGLSPIIAKESTINASNGVNRLGRMIIIISDIHLNDEKTRDKLNILFTGYDSMVPIPDCFILVGDFVSKQCSEVSQFKAHMKNLIKMISTFKKISRHSQFIFVPGFNDMNASDFPKTHFPIDMFPTSTTKISNYYLATNPVNIYIDGRHICLSGNPYISKLNKHIIHNNTEDSTEFGSSIAKIVLSNAHLTTGLDKSFHNSLSLFHLPDLLMITDYKLRDSIDSKLFDFVNFVNLPSFSKSNFKFKVFYTNPKQIEDSQILV